MVGFLPRRSLTLDMHAAPLMLVSSTTLHSGVSFCLFGLSFPCHPKTKFPPVLNEEEVSWVQDLSRATHGTFWVYPCASLPSQKLLALSWEPVKLRRDGFNIVIVTPVWKPEEVSRAFWRKGDWKIYRALGMTMILFLVTRSKSLFTSRT